MKPNFGNIIDTLIAAGIIALFAQNLNISQRLTRVETKLEIIQTYAKTPPANFGSR